jgi:hypothetical protein
MGGEMPYMLVRRGSDWYVHGKNPDGSPGKRKNKKPMSKVRAQDYMEALYANSGDAEFVELDSLYVNPVEDHPEAFFQFKGLPDGRWTAFYSNNFQDMTGEWFPEKGIDTYIDMLDTKQYDMPYLFFWHIPYPLGRADWVGRVGHVVAAVGHYEDFGDKEIFDGFMDYFGATDDPFMVSHGFIYNSKDKIEDAYTRFRTFEISPIPVDKGVPANPLTVFKSVQEFNMFVVNDEKKAKLAEILGPEVAERFLTIAEKYSDEIKGMKLRYKEGDAGEVAPVALENAGEDTPETPQVTEGEPQTPETTETVEEVVEKPEEKAFPKPEDGPVHEKSEMKKDEDEEEDAGEGEDKDEMHKKMHKKEQGDTEVIASVIDARALDGKFTALETKIKGIEEAITGLSNFVRLQFDDPRPASKSDETRVDGKDALVSHLTEKNLGQRDPNDPLPDLLPMFFGKS